ncbi:MAG TPA: hypothetical protein VMS88_00370 [Terriglobales bacterium]|nr:hypothetical protein [Terriglobales bacterium]
MITGIVSSTNPLPSPGQAGPRAPAAAREPREAARPESVRGDFWELLTPEERAFFAERGALGSLSYGPRSRREAPSPGPLGQRVDLRG